MRWNIVYYRTARGRCPVKDFISALDSQTKSKVGLSLNGYLASYGLSLRPPRSKQIVPNLYELRIPGKTSVRLFYSFINLQIVILHGFVKKTDRVQDKELRTAKRRRQSLLDYK